MDRGHWSHILAIAALLLVSIAESPYSQEPDLEKLKVSIKLVEEKTLRLCKYMQKGEKSADVFVRGVLSISITNRYSSSIVLLDMDVHNLVFVKRENGKETVVIHPCACVGLFSKSQVLNMLLTLNPRETKRITIDRWGCDSPWTPPEPGMYKVMYRILPFESVKARLPEDEKMNIKQKLECCSQLLQSKEFWEDAFVSNSVDIELKKPVKSKSLW
jgi:hypothetical protein